VTDIAALRAASALAAANRARDLLIEHADVVAKTGLMQTSSPNDIKRPVSRAPVRESRKREVEPASNDSRGGTKA